MSIPMPENFDTELRAKLEPLPHKFGGVQRLEDQRWESRCTCGKIYLHPEKDTVWALLAEHALEAPGGIIDILGLSRD